MAVISVSGDPTPVIGTSEDDTIIDLFGNHDIDGAAGNDIIYALNLLAGNTVSGGDGSDTLLVSGEGLVEGGIEDDRIVLLSGTGTADGGDGNDTIIVVGGGSAEGGLGDDLIIVSADGVANGGDGSDLIVSQTGNATLSGGNENDVVIGGFGDDIISGGDDSGDDVITFTGSTLTSFSAGDVLTGGLGSDTFRFDGLDDDHDLITDFVRGQDRLEISDDVDVTQILITDGALGPGLLIITEGDNGLFLQNVTQTLTQGVDIFFV